MLWCLLPLVVSGSTGFVAATSSESRRIGAASRPWPLPISVSLSSSFGEYRDGHIHAGLDLRTRGREGLACAAVGDGAITRMRAAPAGYGRALYLKLETGETVVYAHLSEFAPRLERYLLNAQEERGTYTVDLFPPASMFPVREGEIIGYSGSTGTRAPHLHFEVRDVRENPVNPLSRGWKLIDDRRPEPRRLIWIPLDASSSVDGVIAPREVSLRRTAAGRYSAIDTVSIAGRLGVGIYAIDRSDANSGKLAPSKVELSVDGALAARIERERFSYAQTGEVSLEYEMGRVRRRGEYFLLLFEREGETLGNRTFVHGGWIAADSLDAHAKRGSTPAGTVHMARIRLFDKNGNSTRVEVPFRTARGGGSASSTANGGASPFGINDYLTIPGGYSVPAVPPAADWTGVPPEYAERGVVTFAATAGRPVMLYAKEHRGAPSLYCIPVPAGSASRVPVPGIGVTLRTRATSLFSSAFAFFSADLERPPAPPERQGLLPLSEPVFFGPWSLAIRSRVDIDFALPVASTDADAAYLWNERAGKWSVVPSGAAGDTVRASVRGPGIYRVCRDTVPPDIARPVLARHTMHATGRTWPEIVVEMTDAGSGIDAAETELLLDGTPVIGRWDPYRKKMFILLREKNIMGEHTVAIVARDHSGNIARSQATLNFTATSRPDSAIGSD